jgi:hypothetical protein
MGWSFMQRQCQNWQDQSSWRKHDDTCPYWMGHSKRKRALKCVGDYHFNQYCRASARLRKLYWKLHPQERSF